MPHLLQTYMTPNYNALQNYPHMYLKTYTQEFDAV